MNNRYRRMLRMKIHRATVTHANVHYEGSLTIPIDLMREADLREYEAVHVWNVTNGARFETYAISGVPGSNSICANGAAAHLASPGDLIIIASFVDVHESDLARHLPILLFVDENNRLRHRGPELPGPQLRPSKSLDNFTP